MAFQHAPHIYHNQSPRQQQQMYGSPLRHDQRGQRQGPDQQLQGSPIRMQSPIRYQPLSQSVRSDDDKKYYTQRPDLWRLLGKKRMNYGINVYSEWCEMVIQQRRAAMVIFFIIWMFLSLILSWIPHWFINFLFSFFIFKDANQINVKLIANYQQTIEHSKIIFNSIYNYIPLSSWRSLWYPLFIPSIYAIFLFIRSRHLFITWKSCRYLFKNNSLMLIGYLIFGFIGLVISSFYLNWLKSDFVLINVFTADAGGDNYNNNNSNDNTCNFGQISNTVTEYIVAQIRTDKLIFGYIKAMNQWFFCESSRILYWNIILFSYCFGAISQFFYKQNRITIPTLQCSRSDYMKHMIQDVVRGSLWYAFWWNVASFLIYFILDCLKMLTMHGYQFDQYSYLSLMITQFRLIFWLSYMFLSAEYIFNRVFSEKQENMELSPYIVVPSNPSVDVTIYALNRIPQTTRNVEYFWYLSLMELSNLCENSINGRLRIFNNEESFELILHIILADFCEFIDDLYNHILQFHNTKYNVIATYLHIIPQTKSILAHYRALLYDAEILELLVTKSYVEDRKGIVHPRLEKILVTMLDTLSMLDVYLKSDAYHYAYFGASRNPINKFYKPDEVGALENGITRSVVNIYRVFCKTDIRLPSTNATKLNKLLQA